MTNIILSIAPVFALILLGHGLWRWNVLNADFWSSSTKLVYWVLFPSLLFSNTATATFSGELIGSYAMVILGGFACAIVFALVACFWLGYDGLISSSVLQGASRHNSFLALALAERLFGGEGLALAALAAAILIPFTNVVVVTTMVFQLRGTKQKGVVVKIIRDLAKNPLLISIGLGFMVNLFEVGTLPVLHDVAVILSKAGMPMVLLCIGASIRLNKVTTFMKPTLVSMAGKMVLFPAMILLLSQMVDLSGTAASVALLFGAVPTATSAYMLARQMGGDAPLMAAMITLQTLFSFLTLPLTVALAGS